MRAFIVSTVLALLLQAYVYSADVQFVLVTKGVVYSQDGTGGPALQSSPYEFRALVELARTQSVSSVTLRWPGFAGVTRPLTNQINQWEFRERFTSEFGLSVAHPNGTYRVELQSAADGRKTNNLTLSADYYPNPVRIANFAETQSVNPRADFTLRWDPTATGANDLIQVRVFRGEEIITQSGSYPGAPGALNGSAGSWTIPRNTLEEGAVYRVEISALRRANPDPNGYPGVAAWAAYSRRTEFELRTGFSVPDVHWFGVAKVQKFAQTSPLPALPAAGEAYAFTAFLDATDSANVEFATIRAPAGITRTLGANGASWRLTETFGDQGSLDAAYPAGSYGWNMDTAHNGIRQPLMQLPSGTVPSPAQLANWLEANSIDSVAPFTLRWTSLAAGTSEDFVQVIARRNGQIIFKTGDHPAAAGALNGTSTSCLLPMNLLRPGEAAEVSILRLKPAVIDLTAYPGARGFAGYGTETTATIQARGGNAPAARLTAVRRAGGEIELEVNSTPGRLHAVEGSTDLVNWSHLHFTNAVSSQFLFRIGVAQQRHMMLRVVVY